MSVVALENYRLQVFLENDKQVILDLKELIETRKQLFTWGLARLSIPFVVERISA